LPLSNGSGIVNVVLARSRRRGKPGKFHENPVAFGVGRQPMTRSAEWQALCVLRSRGGSDYFEFQRAWRRGSMMARFSAAAVLWVCGSVFIAVPPTAQSDQATAPSYRAGEVLKDGVCVPDEGKCFPRQEFRDGN